MRSFRVLVAPGDGIGREVIPAALEVLHATGLPLDFMLAEAGWECFQRHGTSLADETLSAARAADAVLFGAVSSPSHPVAGYRSPIVGLRRALDLYANIRPVVGLQIADCKFQIKQNQSIYNLQSAICNLVVVRENTEDLYTGQETSDGETAVAQRVITRKASERIARVAFELARSRHEARDLRLEASESLPVSSLKPQAPKVTIVHKANVLRETCGLFRAAALHVAEQYPDVAVDEQLVDSAALQLVQRPERFDVIVTTNMFGDILSDVASHWCGGLGLATSANIGDKHALFEPVHGSAPDIAGKGIANPLAAIGCAAMLLDRLANCRLQSCPEPSQRIADCTLPGNTQVLSGGEQSPSARDSMGNECQIWANRIRSGIQTVLTYGPHTPDLGGSAHTEEITTAVISTMTTM
ncbi:MAG TPA: isocitrate/isopropylmalate dehydrogenase family protein [Roseiflexaceae bacterium]|nr:isocitrate/isopropylmalate dehydrogenase family protein [Roseiflexaceae bacterium]